MINYPYTLTNRNGDEVKLNDFVTDPNNFIALQEYPVFDVDIKNAETNKEGQHGIWDFYSFYGKRAVTFSGVIVGETEGDIERQKLALIKLFSLPSQPNSSSDGYVTVKWTDANGDDWQFSAKQERGIRFDRAMKQTLRLNFQLNLKSSDPKITSQELNTETGARGYRAVTNILPAVLPYVFGSENYNALTINQGGTVSADTLIRLNAESAGITNPKITNLTTGKYFQVNVSIADGDYVEIDSANGTVVDSFGNDLSAHVEVASEFVLLEPDDNVLLYESDENPYATLVMPTAVFTVKYRDTII